MWSKGIYVRKAYVNQMTGTNPPSLIERAESYSQRKLSPKEYEALNHYRADWANKAGDCRTRIFVLGSFADDDVARVNEVKQYINQKSHNGAVAYRMDDFVKENKLEINAIMKFKLLADDSDHIITVCEHDEGGQLIEQGIIIDSKEYMKKSHLLKRAYDSETEKEQYSWMQSKGVFDMFSDHDCLHEWEDTDEFSEVTKRLVSELV